MKPNKYLDVGWPWNSIDIAFIETRRFLFKRALPKKKRRFQRIKRAWPKNFLGKPPDPLFH